MQRKSRSFWAELRITRPCPFSKLYTRLWRIFAEFSLRVYLFVCFVFEFSVHFTHSSWLNFTSVISTVFSFDLFDSMTYLGQVCGINSKYVQLLGIIFIDGWIFYNEVPYNFATTNPIKCHEEMGLSHYFRWLF